MMLKSVHELVREYKFKFRGTCSCGGYETHKYKNENGVWLEWRKFVHTFKLYNADKILSDRWENLLNLESKLKQHAATTIGTSHLLN